MVGYMLEILRKYFGEDVSCEIINSKLKVPLIIAKREMHRITMNQSSFALIHVGKHESFGCVALKKQINLYEEQLQCNAAYAFDMITQAQRDALLRNRLPFISLSPEQIYLPFLGVVLNENFKKEKIIKTDKMMPATQQLFLYMLYEKEDYVLKSEAAETLGLTRTSITRASEQLLAMGLIEQEKVGKEIRMFKKHEPKKMFESAKPYLINPVQKKIVLRTVNLEVDILCAGESALSEYSMLGEPKIKEVAVFKGAINKKDIQEVDIRWEDIDAIVILELWKYDPFLFSRSGKVDPISLACSLIECEDERVEMAIDEMLEELEW